MIPEIVGKQFCVSVNKREEMLVLISFKFMLDWWSFISLLFLVHNIVEDLIHAKQFEAFNCFNFLDKMSKKQHQLLVLSFSLIISWMLYISWTNLTTSCRCLNNKDNSISRTIFLWDCNISFFTTFEGAKLIGYQSNLWLKELF